MSFKRFLTTFLIILLVLTLGQTFAFAQDASGTATPDASATPEPTPTPAGETLLDRLRRILGEDLPDSSSGSTGTSTGPANTGSSTPAPVATNTPVPTRSPEDWSGQYFNNGELRGNPVKSRFDNQITFNWGGGSPFPEVPVNGFSARWTRNLGTLPRGFHNITVATDFGARVYVNGFPVVNHEGGPRNISTAFWTDGDKNINIRVEYRHDSGNAYFTFRMANGGISAAPFGRATVVNGTPALRDGPGQFYWQNGRVNVGQSVILTGHRTEAGNWVCVVTDDGTVGWLNVFYLQSSTVFGNLPVWPMNFPGPEADSTVRQGIEQVRLRYGPGTFYPSFDWADRGERLVLVGRNDSNDWLLVRKWDGALGWTEAANLNLNYRISDLPIRWLE